MPSKKPAKPKAKRVKKSGVGAALKHAAKELGLDTETKPPFSVGQRWRMRNGQETILEQLLLDGNFRCVFDYIYRGEDGYCYGEPDRDLVSLIEDAPKEKSHLEIKAEDDGEIPYGGAILNGIPVTKQMYAVWYAVAKTVDVSEERGANKIYALWIGIAAILALQIAGMVM